MRNKLNKFITEIPYEGQEIDMDGIEGFIHDLLKGFITHSHKFTKTTNGYDLNGKIYNRDEIVDMFLNKIR